ncbi:MAG: hypothetical protein A2Y21_12035 [Clostridiales bacterium GWC2_40_7]|nr:MAG: hypothetical protein A2Y21_12035 [Clostridiales bacterium GWC2_40_7]
MKSERKDLYSILGVKPEATQADLRAAYRSAAMRNHPDRFVSYAQILWATQRMQDINHAYSVLRDPAKRRAYNQAHPIPPVWKAKDKVKAAPLQPSKKVSRDEKMFSIIGGAVWLLAAASLAYFQADNPNSKSVGSWAFSFAWMLFVTPFLFITILFVIILPCVMVVAYFSKASSDKRFELDRTERHNIWRDLFIRIMLLCAVVSGLMLAFNWGINSDILYLILLAWMCGILGELAAMILWITRGRKVVAETYALLKVDN